MYIVIIILIHYASSNFKSLLKINNVSIYDITYIKIYIRLFYPNILNSSIHYFIILNNKCIYLIIFHIYIYIYNTIVTLNNV